MQVQTQVGPIATTASIAPGTVAAMRSGNLGDVIVSELHGRFYEQAYRGNVYTGGINALTALSANTITLTATTTPILGVWNNLSNSVNLVILQASLQIVPNNLTSGAAPGALVWAASTSNGAISTGNAPINVKTLTASGSQAKFFTPSVALTALTNNLVIIAGADIPSPSGLTYTTLGSTAIIPPVGGVQNFDGGLIVPPGGVLALLNTVSSTTFSVYGRITWEEVPV
jgi:hypothetical protein